MIRVKLLTITVEAGAVSLLLVFLSSSLSNSLSNSADTVPRLLQSDEFDHHELLLPFPGSDILKLRIPPCAYPAGSANHAEMLRTYQAMMDDLRSWLGRNGDYTPLMADFQAYAHRRNHMDSMTIAEGGNELWGRIYMTFLHYSVGLAWGEVVPGLPPGWCEPWPSCVYATEIPLPGVSSDWCRPWKECASQASHVKSAEVQRNVASIRVPLPSRADSAQECGSTGIVDTASEMLYFPRSPGCPTMTAMVRFNDLPFSRDAIVESGHLQFQGKLRSGAVSLLVFTTRVDDVPPLENTQNWISSQPLSSSSCDWHLAENSPWAEGTVQTTPDLSDLILEIIKLDGWQAGNSMAFVIKLHDDLEALMEMATSTSNAVSHEQAHQTRFRTVDSYAGIALTVSWREPNPAAAMDRMATGAQNGDWPSDSMRPVLQVAASAVMLFAGVAAAITLFRRYKRHGGVGKRYSRLPMSGVEIEARIPDVEASDLRQRV